MKNGLKICQIEVFNKVDSLEYNKTTKTASYLSVFNRQFTKRKTTKRRQKLIKTYLLLKYRLNIIYNYVTHKVYRIWVI